MSEGKPPTGFSPTLIGPYGPQATFRPAATPELDAAPGVSAARLKLLWMDLTGEDGTPRLDRLDLGSEWELADHAILLDCSRNPADPAVLWLGSELAALCDVAPGPETLSGFPRDCLLSTLAGKAQEAIVAGSPIRTSARRQRGDKGPSIYRARFLPIASDGQLPDHVLAIITASDIKGVGPMDKQGTAEEILELDNELMTEADFGGDDAIPAEPGVLLLDDEAPLQPLVKKIDVRPRLRKESRQDARLRDDSFAPAAETGWRPPLNSHRPSLRSISTAPATGAPGDSGGDSGTGQPIENAPASALERLLAEARALADRYGDIEARTRGALYDALGRAYDFSLEASSNAQEFAAMLAAAGIEMQDRAPHTPIVKLVFGSDYDKTRLAEFASVIAWCQRKAVPRGEASALISGTPGGIKRIVELERLLRRGEDGEPTVRQAPRPAIARKLGAIDPIELAAMGDDGDEFMLVVARRMPEGGIGVLGEVPRDISMLEKAARSLLAEQGRRRKARQRQD